MRYMPFTCFHHSVTFHLFCIILCVWRGTQCTQWTTYEPTNIGLQTVLCDVNIAHTDIWVWDITLCRSTGEEYELSTIRDDVPFNHQQEDDVHSDMFVTPLSQHELIPTPILITSWCNFNKNVDTFFFFKVPVYFMWRWPLSQLSSFCVSARPSTLLPFKGFGKKSLCALKATANIFHIYDSNRQKKTGLKSVKGLKML